MNWLFYGILEQQSECKWDDVLIGEQADRLALLLEAAAHPLHGHLLQHSLFQYVYDRNLMSFELSFARQLCQNAHCDLGHCYSDKAYKKPSEGL